jgi:hypothetical protein
MTDNNRNLLVRVVTALVLLPLIIWLVWLGGIWFALLIAAAAGMCALEVNLLPANLPREEPEPGSEEENLSRKQRQKKRSLVQRRSRSSNWRAPSSPAPASSRWAAHFSSRCSMKSPSASSPPSWSS